MNKSKQNINPAAGIAYLLYLIPVSIYQVETISRYLRGRQELSKFCTNTSWPSVCNVEQERFIGLAALSFLSLVFVIMVGISLRNSKNFPLNVFVLIALHFIIHFSGLVIYLTYGGRLY